MQLSLPSRSDISLISKPKIKLNMNLGRRMSADVVGLDIQPGFVAAVKARVNGSIVAEQAASVALGPEVVRDGEVMDGILPNNLLAWENGGYTITPPETDGNNQKIFVPREALRSMQVLGVVGSPLRGKKTKAAPAGDQPSLF